MGFERKANVGSGTAVSPVGIRICMAWKLLFYNKDPNLGYALIGKNAYGETG
jgi:hypothetical protein